MRVNRTRWLIAGLVAVVVAESAFLAWPVIQNVWLSQGTTAVERGARVAENLGCFTCHGPLGRRGIPNPGSPQGEVPAWSGGTYMMYVASPEEIKEWILYGAPRRKLDDPFYREQMAKGLLQMPAYEGFLNEEELRDLIAFYKAVAWADSPPPEARSGRSIARVKGCFACHGEEGRARQPNPGSLKGYIPSWEGNDFLELVRDEGELRQWILDGGVPRFTEDRAARFFIERQRIQMPAFRDILSQEEVDQLVAYIQWLRRRDKEV